MLPISVRFKWKRKTSNKDYFTCKNNSFKAKITSGVCTGIVIQCNTTLLKAIKGFHYGLDSPGTGGEMFV